MPPETNESEGRARRWSNPRWFWQSAPREPSGEGAETPEAAGAFVSYPTKRVVGTIGSGANAEAAVEALLRAGFEKDAIEVFQEKRVCIASIRRAPIRDDSLIQQLFIQSVGDFPELSLKRHAEDLRAGKIVMMVLAKKPQQRNLAADILSAHGAEFIGYYGRWYWESLAGRQAAVTSRDPAQGQMYETEVAGVITRIRFQSKVAATISGARARSNVAVVPLRPGIKMLSWKDEQGLAVVHVHDYENGRAFAVIAQRDGTLRNLTGTVRRLT